MLEFCPLHMSVTASVELVANGSELRSPLLFWWAKSPVPHCAPDAKRRGILGGEVPRSGTRRCVGAWVIIHWKIFVLITTMSDHMK